MLDSSGSIGEDNFNRFKTFIKELLHEIDVHTCRYRIGLLKFGSNALVQFHLRRYESTPDLLTAIDNVGYR